MYVLFLNVKNRRGTPWSTIDCTDCSVASRVVVMVQWLAHLTCNQGTRVRFPLTAFERVQLVVRCRDLFTLHYMYIYKSKHTRQRSAVATQSFTPVGDLQATELHRLHSNSVSEMGGYFISASFKFSCEGGEKF